MHRRNPHPSLSFRGRRKGLVLFPLRRRVSVGVVSYVPFSDCQSTSNKLISPHQGRISLRSAATTASLAHQRSHQRQPTLQLGAGFGWDGPVPTHGLTRWAAPGTDFAARKIGPAEVAPKPLLPAIGCNYGIYGTRPDISPCYCPLRHYGPTWLRESSLAPWASSPSGYRWLCVCRWRLPPLGGRLALHRRP